MELPFAAAGVGEDALVALFVVLLAAKVGEEVCRRIDQPPIIGEILAGVLVGPSVLGLVEPSEVLEVFSELGVVLLLFVVGLETRLSDMRAVGGRAVALESSVSSSRSSAGSGSAKRLARISRPACSSAPR